MGNRNDIDERAREVGSRKERGKGGRAAGKKEEREGGTNNLPSEERIEGGIMMGVITDGISTPLTFSPMMCMASANLRVRDAGAGIEPATKNVSKRWFRCVSGFCEPPPHPSMDTVSRCVCNRAPKPKAQTILDRQGPNHTPDRRLPKDPTQKGSKKDAKRTQEGSKKDARGMVGCAALHVLLRVELPAFLDVTQRPHRRKLALWQLRAHEYLHHLARLREKQ